jgi:dolichyl-diphosphooligosaccharide--protein glycosyltransferase
VGILILAFSTAFIIRSQPLEFGFELHEFDPFFNYRATQYLVDNGWEAYYAWNDDLSWYPDGRDVSSSSQVVLHQTAAVTYTLFGFGSPLYDFTIMFPVVFGSLSVIVIFALVRVIGGTTAGLIAAMLMSVSLPIIIRGTAGWFKSEPLGLFYGLLGTYLFLSGIKTDRYPIAAAKLFFGALFVSFSLSAWGGSQFFVIPIGVFIMCLPFIRKDRSFLIWAVPFFAASLLSTSMLFERPGLSFVLGFGGIAILGPTIFLVICSAIHKVTNGKNARRNYALLLIGIVVAGAGTIPLATEVGVISTPSFRYLNAVNPFLVATDPLTDSVSEHQTTSIMQSFLFHSVLMVFAGIGIWLLLDKRAKEFHKINSDMIAFALVMGIFGVYISSAFIRLEVFGSIAVIVLSALGVSVLVRRIMTDSSRSQAAIPIRMGLVAGVAVLLVLPLIIPDTNTIAASQSAPSILSGATVFGVTTNDWLHAYEWVKNNTPKDAVVASWWDYGYWTQTLGERASIADNATTGKERIEDIATMFLSHPDEAHAMLKDLYADYIMIFVAAERLQTDGEPLYVLGGGGDESKKQWFMRIAGEPVSKYTLSDGISGTDYYWSNTMLGMMMPFSPVLYLDPNTNNQFTEYIDGTITIYTKNIKYPADGDGPLRLAYASPSFENDMDRIVFGILIYEVNPDYIPE